MHLPCVSSYSCQQLQLRPSDVMMRIAIAGTNGFAQYLCHYIREQTPHQFILLSRRANAGLTAKGWQVISTDYDSHDELVFHLMGTDVLISTIAGSAQLHLIDAAVAAGVRRFVPSEFGGMPARRRSEDPTDRGRLEAISKLESLRLQHRLDYTIFVCGLFYERFAPGGLAASQIDTNQILGREGEFLADIRGRIATFPVDDALIMQDIPERCICMTSSRDAARFVVAALQLQSWPTEFRFYTERMTLQALLGICETISGNPFTVEDLPRSALDKVIAYASATGNKRAEACAIQHLYAIEGRFDISDTNLSQLVKVDCEKFRDWLEDAWKPILEIPLPAAARASQSR